MPLETGRFYEFGPYRVDSAERRLLRGDAPIPLTPKAFDTLLALVENAGRGLEKDELLHLVWPDTFVEEGSLTRNISVLRKALGGEESQFIETIPKRGYRFVAPVTRPPDQELIVDEQSCLIIEETETTSRFWLSPRWLAAILLLLAIGGAVVYLVARRIPGHQERSLAVLPLKNLNGGSAERHLELGFADNIISYLSQISELTVRPTGAVQRYAGSSADPLQVARDLKVDLVLEGTLQMANGRIHINLNLLRASTGASVWVHPFESASSDMLDLEDTVARQVASELRARLGLSAQTLTWRRGTKNPEAYEYYLRGLYSGEVQRMAGGTRGSLETQIARFQKSAELDPSFGEAWAQLALAYLRLARYYAPNEGLIPRAEEAAKRAAAIDPDLPELLAYRSVFAWSWYGHYNLEEGIRISRRALIYNSAEAHSRLGANYFHAGLNDQSIHELKRAVEIDPANGLHLDRLGQAYVWAGRFDEARAAFDRAFAIESDAGGNFAISAVPFLYAGDFGEARKRLEAGKARDPKNALAPAYLAVLAALQGKFQEAEAGIPAEPGDLVKIIESHHTFYAWASAYALEGKSAEAVRWLRLAVDGGMRNYPMYVRDPFLNRIRSSREFVEFMAEFKPRWEAMEREFR